MIEILIIWKNNTRLVIELLYPIRCTPQNMWEYVGHTLVTVLVTASMCKHAGDSVTAKVIFESPGVLAE
jgi:hypothetical protein